MTTAVFLVWTMATVELSGCAFAFAFYQPLRVGIVAALILGPLDMHFGHLDEHGAMSTQ